MKVVRPGPRSVRRVDALQGDEKVREAGREVAQISYTLRRGSVAFDPSVDGPLPRITIRWLSYRQRRWNRKRQQRRQFWKPTVFLLHLQRIVGGTRQAHDHVLAEAKGSVVPSDHGWPDRKVRPLRKPSGHHAANERAVYDRPRYVHLVSSTDTGEARTYSVRLAKRRSSSSESRKYTFPVK